ncbi:uncharacterized protein [Dermacentor andersoni]|uniref:uncharacterized protein n=1 Tax=Dermacentor andersoni TaxID=34620 RepID=UPI00215524E4|nr:uncharacterized protein LOC126529880 [Dermacentor andersoni]
MALTRLEWHLESQGHLPDTLIGFRRHVCAQDVALQITTDVYDHPSSAQLRTIVGVDIKRAFDNVLHQAIIDNLAATKPGERMVRYVCAFPSARQVRFLGRDTQPSMCFPINRGTPQGSILSPTLSKLAMKDLPGKLNLVTGRHLAAVAGSEIV